MKYRDLIQFDPIESVIQLREADDRAEAERLVRTYVISDRLAEVLTRLVFPQLQYTDPLDNRGLFIVGNYGTGKSHLMSVLSAIAEHTDLAAHLTNAAVAEAARPLAGQFKVVRAEIGTTTMRLRDILLGELEMALADWGISYEFPPLDQVSNSKDILIEMMGYFDQQFPGQGLLLIVDELLEFLRSRHDQALVLDLSFLRELGEVSRSSRFRFVAGIQESIFDSPRFQFVAEAVRRVRDRFEQVRITREDVAFVVAERLLRKDERQKVSIRHHLSKFTPLYTSMAEKLTDFIRLFPVHPAYLETFEQIYVAEKREVLKSLSGSIQAFLDQDVPPDKPGLIAYDAYWTILRDNPSFRSIPEIREVIDKSRVLEDRITSAFTRPTYKPAAIRIVHALSVHRLTTGDIYAPLGATVAELTDDLCLYLAGLPEAEAGFLQSSVQSVLNEILRTVSGQFISFNSENGQYYLDLKKDIDFEALIEQRAASLSESQLDRAYFEALARLMECPDATYVPGYRIWEHEVEWRERRVARPGYLFFGAPNERSTAQPPREFYLYMLQPKAPPPFRDDYLPDEVFFRLARPDAEFETALKLYAGAREMSMSAAGENRLQYNRKADEHLRTLQNWLRDHLAQAFDVTHQGQTKPLIEWTKSGTTAARSMASVRDLVNTVAANCLAKTFADVLPDYPTFSVLITGANQAQAAGEAVRWLTGGLQTQQGRAVLDALGLLDAQGRIQSRESRYAAHFLAQLQTKGGGQVLNRAELIEGPTEAEFDRKFKLEPPWVAVTLLALVYSGDITLALPGRTLDAGDLDEAHKLNIEDLAHFKFIRRPKGIPLAALTALFELLDLIPGLIRDPNQHDTAVQQLYKQVSSELDRLVLNRQKLQDGLLIWGAPLFEGETKADLLRRLDEYKSFLESLQAFNTPGKLRNFRYTVEEVQAQAPLRALLRDLIALSDVVAALQPLTAYLGEAISLLPADEAWIERATQTQTDQLTRLRSRQNWSQPTLRATLVSDLEALKRDYTQRYQDLHRRARLSILEEDQRKRLLGDPRRKQLTALADIAFLPVHRLQKWEERLTGLSFCQALGASDLQTAPRCQSCDFRPREEPATEPAGASLTALEDELAQMHADWTQALLSNLSQETTQANIALLSTARQKRLADFQADGALPQIVDYEFVQTLREAFSNLESVIVMPEDILLALTEGGMPCTVQELEKRFRRYLDERTKGKDLSKIRIVVEW